MYLSADIFVLPTMKDHYGVVFLEAMSAGLPLVGTRSFTVPELIEDGKNGFLVEPRHTKGLAQAIKEMFQDYPLRKKMGENAASLIAEKYNVHDWCRKIERHYMALSEQK